MPLRLTLLESLLARLNILPSPLFDMPLAQGIGKVLVAACELELFDAVPEAGISLEDLAEILACRPHGLQLLLQLLVSSGYLRHRSGRYYNTQVSRRWLTSDSPVSIAPYIVHSPDIVAIWDHLPQVIRTDQQAMCMPYEEDASNPETHTLLMRHYAGLASLATALGRDLTRHIHLPTGSTRLLDVGGSHAAYSALLCRKYPRLHATILDIPPGIEAGQRTARRLQLEQRMDFVCGDIVQDDFTTHFTEPFDVALYFHIAHLLQPAINQAILTKVVHTLKPGGLLVFVDQVTDQTHGSHLASLMVQFMALTMATVGGTCYPFPTVKGWLEQASMSNVRSHRLLTPGASMITATKNS
ncbi:MAG: methyltransferase [Ktedonobacteraceae bacterium]